MRIDEECITFAKLKKGKNWQQKEKASRRNHPLAKAATGQLTEDACQFLISQQYKRQVPIHFR
jgi:hypothetical protein